MIRFKIRRLNFFSCSKAKHTKVKDFILSKFVKHLICHFAVIIYCKYHVFIYVEIFGLRMFNDPSKCKELKFLFFSSSKVKHKKFLFFNFNKKITN